jgi:hypothetical protein
MTLQMRLLYGVRLKSMRKKLKLQLHFNILLTLLAVMASILMMKMTFSLNLKNKDFYCTLFFLRKFQAK